MDQEFKKQVMRILNKMVKSGEVITKISADGETLYAIAPAQKYTKSKQAGNRTSAALKAWETRRKTKKAPVAKGKAVKSKPSKKGSLAALKAWETRRKAAKTKTMRKEAAKKAWDTRKKNASNPLLRGKFLK